MRFFLDTVDLDELKKASTWGIIDGIAEVVSTEGGETIRMTDKSLDRFLKNYKTAFEAVAV